VIAFETDVHIDRPIEEVFAYVSDPLTFPRWNSAVQAVRRTSAAEPGVRSTYLMERELPTGRAVNELEVVESERPHEFAIRATAGPTPFLYRYRFSAENGKTVIRLDARSSSRAPPPYCQCSPGASSRGVSMTTSRR
jgi:uncharacterized protein YndB with AHSA1/START domain